MAPRTLLTFQSRGILYLNRFDISQFAYKFLYYTMGQQLKTSSLIIEGKKQILRLSKDKILYIGIKFPKKIENEEF